MSERHVAVLLTGDHPHAGEKGHIVERDGKVTVEYPAGVSVGMVRVELENCQHGVEACYAQGKDLRRL